MNGKAWSSTNVSLYKPVGSNGTFVKCRRCNNIGQLKWYNSRNKRIKNCERKISQMICVSVGEGGDRDLKFLNFMQSQMESYTCENRNGMDSIIINALSLIPINQLVTDSTINVTLNCETTGDGSIIYQWETSNINGGQWMNISDSNSKTLVVGTLEQSQQYRCVVSNEAGSTRSNAATVTVLSKYTYVNNSINNYIVY